MSVIQYRSLLSTRLDIFVLPWLGQARETGGLIHPQWNQVKDYSDAAGAKGTRTGRLSTSRFQNVPVSVGTSQHDSIATLGYEFPNFIEGITELPACRKYLIPDKGTVWCKRDYAQQELRVLAHFEDGVLLQEYRRDPRLDVHQLACDLIEKDFGVKVGRTRTKTIGFSLLYGMGIGELARRLGMEVGEAKKLKRAYLDIFPGLKELQDDLTHRGRTGLSLRTWGGREYFCEPPAYSKKHRRMQTFEYKLLNYLIQGSAADCTKQAIVNHAIAGEGDARFLVTVHDEVDFCCPAKAVKKEMARWREQMADVQFDVPMLSDGKTGINWGELKKYEEEEWRPRLPLAA
jgi:hypothetical protein